MADETSKTEAPKATDAKDEKAGKTPTNVWIGAGIGAGIGSAAIAAAVLYATRSRKKKSAAKD